MFKHYLTCFTKPSNNKIGLDVTCNLKPKTNVEAKKWFEKHKCVGGEVNDFTKIGEEKTKHQMELGVISTMLLKNGKVKDKDVTASEMEDSDEGDHTEMAKMYVVYRFGKEVYKNF